MLKLTCRDAGERVTIAVDGELAIETVDAFESGTAQLSAPGRPVDLDCSALSFVDSTGVNALLKVALRWRNAGIVFTISNLSSDLKEMLGVLGFFEVVGEQG